MTTYKISTEYRADYEIREPATLKAYKHDIKKSSVEQLAEFIEGVDFVEITWFIWRPIKTAFWI